MAKHCELCNSEYGTSTAGCLNPKCDNYYAKPKLMVAPPDETWAIGGTINKTNDTHVTLHGSEYFDMQKAIKHDQGKLRYDLIPTDSLKELVKVFTYGVEKYDDRNWEKGIEWGRIYGAIQRHLNAFWSGEEINNEDADLSHLAQAAWGCLVLEAYRLRKIGTDTREQRG